MIYYYLAESLTELDKLSHLISKMEMIRSPLPELRNLQHINEEMERIKKTAAADILIFGMHASIYLNANVKRINYLIIYLNEILAKMPELAAMSEMERYRYVYYLHFKEELMDLSDFFYQLYQTINS